MTGFSRSHIALCLVVAIGLHVAILAATSMGYIRDTWIDPEGAELRRIAKTEAAEAAFRTVWSLPGSVDVIGGKAENALLVPVEALKELGVGEYAVFVVADNGELEMRPVEVGLMDYANAQIINGLEMGEQISTGIVETN